MVANCVNEWIPNNMEMIVRVLLRYGMCVSLAFIPTLDTAIFSAHVYPKYTAKRTTSNKYDIEYSVNCTVVMRRL